MPNQRGLVPLVPLIAISVAGIAILLILFFSIKSFIPTTPETSLSTQPTPDPTSSSVKNTDFTRVELALDLSKTRAMYCINDQFELINKENEQYKIELRLAQECQKNYEKYSTETTAMRESCIEICESTQSASIKKCEVDVGTADDSDYNFLFCKNDAISQYTSCMANCKMQVTKSQTDYNRDCQKPVVDQAFRIDDLVKKYCQQNPN